MPIIEKTVGQLARQIPGATALFNQLGLDFCCGGNVKLKQALAEHDIDQVKVIAALDSLAARGSDEKDWSSAPDTELIDHILTRYHDVHREQLTELIRLASRVEHVHGDKPECPKGLAQHLMLMDEELNNHMQKEEQILFPMLKAGQRTMAQGPIHVMRHDHDDHARALDKLYALTDNITLPKGACNTWRALFAGLQAFVDDLKQHIHLENNILFEAPEPNAQFADVGANKTHGVDVCCGSCGGT
ncbi:iron-sulfur cluster repair protein YtfE [Simiduia litorea]|uniref:iron-sulfur cluster repair protein YtfE n=1 Tax=Simiduia litorea TaxID=1435348 RepID=UPI0036F3534D